MEKKSIAMLSMMCGVLAFSACNTPQDVPVPDDQDAKNWAPAIKQSYPGWQSTKDAPAGNANYEAMFSDDENAPATEPSAKPQPQPADTGLQTGSEVATLPAPAQTDAVSEVERAQYPFLYVQAPNVIRLDVMNDGKILTNGNEYPIEIVNKYLVKVAKDNGGSSIVIIRPASSNTPVDKLNLAIDMSKKAGIAAVRFVNPGKSASNSTATTAKKKVKYVVDSSVAPQTYEVKAGDNLGKISQKFYKHVKYTNFILDANPKLKANPNKIRPGMKLVIPAIKPAE